MAPLALVSVAFIAFSLPPYLSLDPSQSRVPQPADLPVQLHFPLLVGHVLFGSVAMLACCLQIWPWLRQRHPVVHRVIGRVYVLGGALPAGLLALAVGAFSPFGPAVRVSNVISALLWLACTIAGYRTARQRRFADHRRWMVRGFALTFSIVAYRVVAVVASAVLTPQLDTTFGGSEIALTQTVYSMASWSSWVGALLIAQWSLERGGAAKRRARTAAGRQPSQAPATANA